MIKINQLNQYKDGQMIPEISGTVTAAFDVEEKQTNFGLKKFQNFYLKDETSSIKVQAENHEPVRKGEILTLRGYTNQQGKGCGVISRWFEAKDGGGQKQFVKVTPSGNITTDHSKATDDNPITKNDLELHFRNMLTVFTGEMSDYERADLALRTAITLFIQKIKPETPKVEGHNPFAEPAIEDVPF